MLKVAQATSSATAKRAGKKWKELTQPPKGKLQTQERIIADKSHSEGTVAKKEP